MDHLICIIHFVSKFDLIYEKKYSHEYVYSLYIGYKLHGLFVSITA